MEPFKNILVGLDTSALDASLVKYAAFLSDHSSAEKVKFVNLVRNLSIPSDVRKEFPHMEENAILERKQDIEKTVAENFKPEKDVDISFTVEKGQPPRMLELADKFDADVIIVGQKKTLPGQAGTTMRLARRAICNLLIVPEMKKEVTPEAEKLMVPVDFSSYSKLALEQAIDFAMKTRTVKTIVCQNVYSVPAGYHYTGKSFEEFGEVMKKNAQENFKKFIKKIDTKGYKIEEYYSLDINDNLASDIYDLADEIHPDFIFIGAKGRTAAAALFLGSLAEKMVNDKMNHPLLITRYKGKSAGLIETFREL
ncbi:MAG: universal stress protein [Bacteroidota bacterium]